MNSNIVTINVTKYYKRLFIFKELSGNLYHRDLKELTDALLYLLMEFLAAGVAVGVCAVFFWDSVTKAL